RGAVHDYRLAAEALDLFDDRANPRRPQVVRAAVFAHVDLDAHRVAGLEQLAQPGIAKDLDRLELDALAQGVGPVVHKKHIRNHFSLHWVPTHHVLRAWSQIWLDTRLPPVCLQACRVARMSPLALPAARNMLLLT